MPPLAPTGFVAPVSKSTVGIVSQLPSCSGATSYPAAMPPRRPDTQMTDAAPPASRRAAGSSPAHARQAPATDGQQQAALVYRRVHARTPQVEPDVPTGTKGS